MEMDFHNLKRRELQVLCKKHKIPANLTNLEMAEKLTALLAVNEKPLTRGRSCLKGSDENVSENESDVGIRPAKKVRFSPENEMIEFEKSEVRNVGIRGRGRRKSVMFEDKGRGVVVNSSDGMNEEAREVRRSRRGKLLEASEIESKGAKRVTEVDASKDNNGTVDDVLNGEGREVRRSRRGKLLEGNEVESKGGLCAAKVDALEDHGIAEDVVNGEVREVRRSRRGKLLEGSKVESMGGRCETTVDALEDNGVVDDVVHGEVREVRRSRRGKLVEGSDALKDSLPSAADNEPSVNLRNEEHIVVKKRSLRNRVVVDEEKKENEVVEKGSKKNRGTKNLRSRKGEYLENVTGRKETEKESASVQHEAVVRRSNRHAEKVDVNENLIKNEKVSRGRSRRMAAMEVNEISEIDNVLQMVVKEGSLVEGSLRRSKRSVLKTASSTSMQVIDVTTHSKNVKEMKKQRRDAVLEEERGKATQKEKSRSNKARIEIEDSSIEDVSTTMADPDAPVSASEAPEDTVMDNCGNVVIDLSAYASDFGSTYPAESSILREGQDCCLHGKSEAAAGTNGQIVHPHSDNDAQKKGGEIFTSEERNKGNNLKPTLLTANHDGLARQNVCMDSRLNDVVNESNNEHATITENTSSESHSVSLRKLTKEKATLESFIGQESEQLNLGNSSELDNLNPLINVGEVGTLDTVGDYESDAVQTPLYIADEHKQEELTSTMHETTTLKLREGSTTMQSNGCEAHNLSATATNFHHPKLSSFKNPKSDEKGNSKIDDELWEPKASDAFKSARRNLLDGNVGSGEDIVCPADLRGEATVSTPLSAEVVETVTEFNESVFHSERVEFPKSNTLEFCVAEKSPNAVDLEGCSELSTESPSDQKEVEAELFEKGRQPLDDGLHHSLQFHESKSSARIKFSVQQDQGVSDNGVSGAIFDVQGVLLSLPSQDTQITEGGYGTEIELSTSKSSPLSASPWNPSSILKSQFAGSNTEKQGCLLRDGNIPNQGYGDCTEGERKEECAPMQKLYAVKTPSTSEGFGLERYNVSMDGSLSGAIDMLDDQQDLTAEVIDKESNLESSCEAAIRKDIHETYIGEEGEPINLEQRNSYELENTHHVIVVSEGELTNIMIPETTLKQREDAEDHNLCASETNFDCHEPSVIENAEPSEESPSKVSCDTFEMHQGFKTPDAFRRMLQGGQVYGGEVFAQLAPLQRTVLDSTPISTTAVETITEFAESISDFIRLKPPTASSEYQGAQSSTQMNGVGEDFSAEAFTKSEDRKNFDEFVKSEEFDHLKDQDKAFDDCLLHDKLNCSARSKFGFIQEEGVSNSEYTLGTADLCGLTLSPTSVATKMTNVRSREIELSARKSSYKSKNSPNFSSAQNFQSAYTDSESKHSLLTDDNVENQGHGTITEDERTEEIDSMQALPMIRTPSANTDDKKESCNMLLDGNVDEVIDILYDEPGPISEGMELKRNYDPDHGVDLETEMQESYIGEASGPINLEATNTTEPEIVHSHDVSLEVATIDTVDGCPSHATHILKNSNENEQGETHEILFTESVSISNSAEENILNFENEMEHDMMMSLKRAISMGRDECSSQSDDLSNNEEQEKDVSHHEDSVDVAKAVENEIQSANQQHVFTNAFEVTNDGLNSSDKWHEDGVKMPFSIPVTGYVNNIFQEHDIGALPSSNSPVASAENKDGLVLMESFGPNGTLLQPDEPKFGDLKFQKEIEIEEESKDDVHTESVVEAHMLSTLEMKTPPPENKGEDSFTFDHTKVAEEETGTSVAILARIDTEEKVTELDIQDPATTKHHQVLKENDVLDTMMYYTDSEFVELLSTSTKNPSKILQNDFLTEVAELIPLVEAEAESVEEPVAAAGQIFTSLAKESVEETVTELVKIDSNSLSGTADHQCVANAADTGVVAVEDNLVLKLKTDSKRSKNLDAVAGESISSAAKSTMKRKNARTILIHGTPKKQQMAAHMKENESRSKLGRVGSLTTVRPAAAKRPTALKDRVWR